MRRTNVKILNEYYLLAMNNANKYESNAKIEIEKEFLKRKKHFMEVLRQKSSRRH